MKRQLLAADQKQNHLQAGGGGNMNYPSPMTPNFNIDGTTSSDNGGCLGELFGSCFFGGEGFEAAGENNKTSCLTTSLRNPIATITSSTRRTKNANDDDDPTTLVAEELKKLSIQEIEKVYEDLHGVSMIEDESNIEFVSSRLSTMVHELEHVIPKSKKGTYLMAMEEFGQQGKDFCHDESLHLMFLRADCWDAKKAAIRFVGWLDWKLKLFGRDALCHRYVTLDDLDQDGRIMVEKSGRIQILPQRDTSGRTVIFDWLGNHTETFRSVKSHLQLFWYMLMASVEDDVQSQRMGTVFIMYAVGGGSYSADDRETFWNCGKMAPCIPMRVGSVQYCYSSKLGPIITMIQTALSSDIRARFRSHGGTPTEVQYSLMTYGLPADVLPVTTDGKVKTNYHSKWYKRRKVRDATLIQYRKEEYYNKDGGSNNGYKAFDGIDLPNRFDILLGKGKPIQESPGNRQLHELVRTYYDEFQAAGHGEKRLLAERIVKMVQDGGDQSSMMGGGGDGNIRMKNSRSSGMGIAAGQRFLKRRNDGFWEPVPDQMAIDKVLHLFRGLRMSGDGGGGSTTGNTKTTKSAPGGGSSATKRFKS